MSHDLHIDRWIKDLPRTFGDIAADIEAQGADGIWTAESTHSALGMAYLAADNTEEITVGTRISLAFVRSPMATAYAAWDLAHYSRGRFVLGLGTQVRAHNERRYGVEWDSPGPRLREVIRAIRHIWDVWQGRADELEFAGDFYEFSLMTENFDPGPIDHPDIPIFIAAINEYNVRTAGRMCDGILLHPFNSPSYVNEHVIPHLEAGASAASRSLDAVTVSASPFVITGSTDEELAANREQVRRRIAFYGSTPDYRPVLEHHGWDDKHDRLHELSREGAWDAMADVVPDAMLDDYAIEAPLSEIESHVADAYDGVADRVVVSADPTGKRGVYNGIYVQP
ncbi:MAG: TIGR03617 family F420-dependent LLM class oxidoreductase [Salinirussus sp.]